MKQTATLSLIISRSEPPLYRIYPNNMVDDVTSSRSHEFMSFSKELRLATAAALKCSRIYRVEAAVWRIGHLEYAAADIFRRFCAYFMLLKACTRFRVYCTLFSSNNKQQRANTEVTLAWMWWQEILFRLCFDLNFIWLGVGLFSATGNPMRQT